MAEGMDLCLGDSDVKEEPKPLMDGTTVTATAPWPGGWFVYSSHVVVGSTRVRSLRTPKSLKI